MENLNTCAHQDLPFSLKNMHKTVWRLGFARTWWKSLQRTPQSRLQTPWIKVEGKGEGFKKREEWKWKDTE